MKSMLILLLVGASIAVVPAASADGGLYPPSGVALWYPYQRALLAYNGKEQLIVLESSFEGAGERPVGWVVPVPAMPDVGALESDVLDPVFRHLDRMSQPDDYHPVVVLAIFTLVVWFLINLASAMLRGKLIRPGAQVATIAAVGILAVVARSCLFFAASPTGIAVVRLGRAGDYDARVLRATDPGELIGWLNANGFKHGDRDRSAFDDYIRRGWVFVVATVAAAHEDTAGAHRRGRGRTTRPLVLQFPVAQPVYPLALTGRSGNEVQVQIYVLAAGRMEGDSRFRVSFAKRLEGSYWPDLDSLLAKVSFAGNAHAHRFEETFVTRLDADLTPDKMREDLPLHRATKDLEYRRITF